MKRGIELRLFHAIWWTLAVLLPDLLAFATRDWRAAIAGAAVSTIMIVLSVRVFTRRRDEITWTGGGDDVAAMSAS